MFTVAAAKINALIQDYIVVDFFSRLIIILASYLLSKVSVLILNAIIPFTCHFSTDSK